MPGKCKFQVAWLAKDIYKDWLVKDPQDIQLARCKACCKAIKLQTMGEAALTSHAAGCGHKAAVRKLVEEKAALGGSCETQRSPVDSAVHSGKQSRNPLSPDYAPTVVGKLLISASTKKNKKTAALKTKRQLSNNETQDDTATTAAVATLLGQDDSPPPQRHITVMNVADHVNGYGNIKDEEDKEPVALSLHLGSAFDRLTGSDPSADLEHGVLGASSASHDASFQEVAFPTSFIDSRGVPSQSTVDCGVPRVQAHNNHHHHHHHPPPRLLLHTPQQPPLHHRPPSPARRRSEEPAPRDTAPPPKFPRTPRSAAAAATAAAAALARRDREQRERVEALEEERVAMLGEQQQAGRREQMESLEWERRMRVLVWEQEVLREKGRAAREKARAYRMKRRYYGAKLKRMGQDVPPPPSSSSSSDSDLDDWGSGERTTKEEAAIV